MTDTFSSGLGSQEGSWTPVDASGAGLSFTGVSAFYFRVGRLIVATFELTYPSTADGSDAVIGGLPFTSRAGSECPMIWSGPGFNIKGRVGSASTNIILYGVATNSVVLNSALSLQNVRGTAIYLSN